MLARLYEGPEDYAVQPRNNFPIEWRAVISPTPTEALSIALPAALFLYLLWRREWEWIGLYVAISFASNAWINGYAVFSHLLEPAAVHREGLGSAMTGCALYFGGMIGAMRGPHSLRTLFVALAAMETLFVGVVPIYRFALGLDHGAYFAINGKDISNGLGVSITLLLAILPMSIGIPWLLARQSASAQSIIAPALSRYGMLSGIGVVAFMIFSASFVAWGYIGRGPFAGEPQRPAFELAVSTVIPNMIFGILMGVVIYLFWSFPKRFFDPMVNLLEASQSPNGGPLENSAHPLWRGIARTLDERRREAMTSQEQLNEARSLLLSFFDAAPADMFVKTVEGKLVYCSPGLASVLGRTQEEMVGLNEKEYHSEEHLQIVRKIDAKLVRDKKPLVAEVFNPVLKRHELQSRFPIMNEAGDVTHIGGMFIDIDARVKAQEKLAEEQARFEAFFEHAPVIMYIRDHNNTVLRVNSWIRQYGLEPEQVMGVTAGTFSAGSEKRVADQLARVMETGQPQTDDYEFQVPIGPRSGRETLFPIRDAHGDVVSIGGMIIDTTDETRERNDRIKAEEWLTSFVEHAPVPMILADPSNDGYVLANSVAADFYDMTAEELVKSDPDYAVQFWPRWKEDMAPAMRKALVDGEPQIVETLIRRKREGTIANYLVSLFTIAGKAGSAPLLGSVGVDITAIRNAEREIADSQAAVHQSEKLAALGQLLAGVAHELNNPLAIVLGRASILQEKLRDTPHAASLSKLRDAAERCARIVKTFLAMARQSGPRREIVQINETVAGALDMTVSGLRKAGITIETRLADHLPEIETDGDQLVQALINLIVNAQHAMESHQGERRLTITTLLDRPKQQLILEVADTGPGVPKELAARVFEPFYTSKDVGKGTGLGLSVCKGMVEANGGDLLLSETPGGGATFRITVPVIAPASAVDAAAPAIATRKPRKMKALVVDDEAELAEILSDSLESLGFGCTVADNGKVALEAVASQKFDAIFCDVRMPVMDGIAFYNALKAHHPSLLSRLAFISGDVLHNDVAALTAEAACPVIEKPFDLDQVRATALALIAAGEKE